MPDALEVTVRTAPAALPRPQPDQVSAGLANRRTKRSPDLDLLRERTTGFEPATLTLATRPDFPTCQMTRAFTAPSRSDAALAAACGRSCVGKMLEHIGADAPSAVAPITLSNDIGSAEALPHQIHLRSPSGQTSRVLSQGGSVNRSWANPGVRDRGSTCVLPVTRCRSRALPREGLR